MYLGEVDISVRNVSLRSPSRILIGAKQWVAHEKFYQTNGLSGDIGLIQLQLAVPLSRENKFISTIPLNNEISQSFVGEILIITG